MAKPINPYQGPAPAAMAQMGAGMAEVGANIGRTLQRGYESMGQGIAGGITAAADAYTQSKQDQAKFDATKKLVKAWESFLPTKTDPVTGAVTTPVADEIKSILADTTISTREKIEMTPMLFNIIGNVQQQAGRESVANIMNQGRVDAANTRRPAPQTGSTFGGVPTLDSIFNSPVGQPPPQPQDSGNLSGLPMNPSQGNPGALMPPSQQGQPASRIGPNGQMEVWSSRLKRYVELDNPMQDIQY